MRRRKGYIAIVFVCLFYWTLDSVWSYFSFELNLKNLIFNEQVSYVSTFLLKVPPYQLVSRLMVVVLFAILGIIIIEFMIRRQASEKERKEAHDTFLTVLNSIDATVYVTDMQSHEILFMNQFMIESFGGNFSGRTCYEALNNNKSICDQCRKDQLVDEAGNPKGVVVWEGRNPITEAWYLNHDRAIKWIDGRVAHLQVATDITQLKELQEKQVIAESQLRQVQKMEAIGNLAGGIAHDFNNILSSIIGFTELALDEVEKESTLEDNLQEVYTAGKRARDLVKQILAFARQSEDNVKPIQVNTVVEEVLKFIRSSLPSTIEIKQDIASDSLIMGNTTQVHQILMNLCTNAAHAMEAEGGTLDISLTDITLDSASNKTRLALKPGDYIRLRVGDTGVGIPLDNINVIFDPYFTTKAPGKGTGMGLATVHGMVESYGGKIAVESRPGQGAVFTIYLPITTKRRARHPHESAALPSGAEHILFVDDEAPIAKMGSQILEGLGYAVTTRTSSIEALELFRSMSDDFDLVISDMTMPNMTGEALAVEMMAIRPDIPVILCTGYSNKISDESASDIGVKAVAYKPIIKSDLAKTVRRVLDETSVAA
jgi:signal transduction histidine kinase/CheY-like chemotaxis protein